MNQRLLAYISLASYSLSNQALKQNNFNAARQALLLYKLSDPENSERPFLAACMYSKLNLPDSAIYSLREALKLGLKDRTKLESEESFSVLRNTTEFRQLLDSLQQ